MDFVLRACGSEKHKDKENKKHKYEKGGLTLLVHGVDDISSGQAKGAIKGIEAGACLHGILLARVKHLPESVVAKAKFELSSRYLHDRRHITHHQDEEGREFTREHHSTEKEKWMKGKTKVLVQPIAGVPIFQDASGIWNIQFPFSYVVPSNMCDSFKCSEYFCRYDLKCKLKFEENSDGSKVKAKSIKREIDIMARRPSDKDLLGPGKVHKDSHMCFAGGAVDVHCTVGAEAFIEGSQVVFEARVKNAMERPIMTGKLELEEHLTSTLKVTDDRKSDSHWTVRDRSRDLVVSKLRGLEIPGNSEKIIKFALDLPRIVEPPSTGFGAKHHKLKVRHLLKFQLDVPWGRDIRMSFPVVIAPNPKRYLVPQAPAQPAFVPVVANALAVNDQHTTVDMATVQVPEGYAVIPVEAIPQYEPWCDPRPRFLVVELVSGHKLPKMDFTFGGLRGAADPYVTIWVNGIHIRTSNIVHNTTEPVFKEQFRFMLTKEDQCDKVKFRFNCYDYDSTSKDDLIGNGELELDLEQMQDSMGKPHMIDLSCEKKGKVKERGQLQFKILTYSSI